MKLSMHLKLEDVEDVCDGTWTPNFVAAYFSLLADRDLRIKYDSTTKYSITRPDIQVAIGTEGRPVAAVEIKRHWAGRVEKTKDQGRVISAVAHYLALDCRTHQCGAPPPARIAL
ncbi:hypothetical protein HDU86_000376 [Geranomyces michiganensis]|nr:hypothetical protein HDU86_000376 [Geranomyces michiganensis]